MLDTALYLPKSWCDDPQRRAEAGVPEQVRFATKPQLAARMIEAAVIAGLPCRWVAGDEAYGGLIRRQAGEILAQHRVAAGRLDLLAAPHALVLGGGVLQARHRQLHDQIVAGARAQAPLVEISVVESPPVVDALGTAAVAEQPIRVALIIGPRR
jgi:hypothetical protein